MTITYSALKKLLGMRFSKTNCHLMTEDLVRQDFIDSEGLSVGNTRIEYAYKKLSPKTKFVGALKDGARADLYYNDKEKVVVEFKYHKQVSTSTTDKTGRFGSVLCDLNRLGTLDQETEKYFIYVCDQEMKDYYDKKWNTKKELEFLFSKNAVAGSIYPIDGGIAALSLPKIALENAFSSFNPPYTTFASLDYKVKVLRNQPIAGTDYYLLILQVI